VLSRTGGGGSATATDASRLGPGQAPRSAGAAEVLAGLGGCSGAAQCGRELFAGFDVEFSVAVGEVHFDGALGDEQGLGDVFVGVALGGEFDDAELGWCERVAAGLCDSAWAGARESQFLACVVDECGGAAAVGELGALGERRAGLGALSGSADGAAEVDQRARPCSSRASEPASLSTASVRVSWSASWTRAWACSATPIAR